MHKHLYFSCTHCKWLCEVNLALMKCAYLKALILEISSPSIHITFCSQSADSLSYEYCTRLFSLWLNSTAPWEGVFFSFLLRAIRYVECRWRIELKYIYIFLIKVHLLHFLPSISLASCQKAAHSLDCTLGCTQVVGWKKLFSFPWETFEWDLLSLALWYCFRPLKAIGSSTLYLLSLGFHFITCLVLHWWGWW